MECKGQIFFITLDHFLPFYNAKIQNFEKIKTCMEISSFYTYAPKIMIICYTLPEIQPLMDVVFIFHFGLFFALFPPNNPKNQNFEKMKKKRLKISLFTHVYQKLYQHDVQFLRCGA